MESNIKKMILWKILGCYLCRLSCPCCLCCLPPVLPLLPALSLLPLPAGRWPHPFGFCTWYTFPRSRLRGSLLCKQKLEASREAGPGLLLAFSPCQPRRKAEGPEGVLVTWETERERAVKFCPAGAANAPVTLVAPAASAIAAVNPGLPLCCPCAAPVLSVCCPCAVPVLPLLLMIR